MSRSPLLEFHSSVFAAMPGEDSHTNPGIFGKALALWLKDRLRESGVPAREVIPEDFGWCIPVTSTPHSLYVACASTESSHNRWRVFAFAEGGLLSRTLGTDQRTKSVAELFAVVRRCLESSESVSQLSELE